MVKLIQGSIFDAKCDLLIIPCNNLGGVSHSIARSLHDRALPQLNHEIDEGRVEFINYLDRFSNAAVLGYAASVSLESVQKTADNIRSIAKDIIWGCDKWSLRKINMPLLGTGAGRLSPEISYQILCEMFAHSQRLDVCIYVLDEMVYRTLSGQSARNDGTYSFQLQSIANPRVFLSYTGSNPENARWVKNLAIKLRNAGVDARLDQFHLKPGQDLPQWMTNEVIQADKVLLICDKFYAEKADMRRGGVGWETMIIQGDMLSNQDQGKYIAILRDDNIDESLPVYVKSKYALNWADDSKADSEFDELLLQLFECNTEPPLGNIPDFIVKNKSLAFT